MEDMVQPRTHLLNKQPGVAGAPEQRWLLQSVFKQSLEGWAEGPSHKVCDALRYSVIPRDGVLWWGTGSERPQPCTCSQSPCPCPHTPCLKPELAQDTGPGQEGVGLPRIEAAAAPRGSPALCPSYLFAPFIQDFHKLGWKPACGRGKVL